jgi:GDP-L-fucose synthase
VTSGAGSDVPRVAVLGGTGFAGRSIVEELHSAGICAQPFSRRTGCDLLNEANAVVTLQRFAPTHLVNCAALVGSVNYADQYAADVVDVNGRLALSTYRIAERLASVVVVNLVANCVYPGDLDVCEESRLWDGPPHTSVQSYGETRRLLLTLADCFRRQKGLASINLIVPNMYGPFDSTDPNKTHALNALALKFVNAAQRDTPQVEVWGTGRPVREWLFVSDLARVVRSTITERGQWTEPFNIGQKRGYTIDELVDLIRRAAGYTGSIVHNLAYGDGAPKKIMDDGRFRRLFPSFAFTPIERGIRATLDYYALRMTSDHEHFLF